MAVPPGILLGPPETVVARSPLMRRHNAALKLLRYTSTTEERLAILLAVVAPSEAMVEAIESIDAGERRSFDLS